MIGVLSRTVGRSKNMKRGGGTSSNLRERFCYYSCQNLVEGDCPPAPRFPTALLNDRSAKVLTVTRVITSQVRTCPKRARSPSELSQPLGRPAGRAGSWHSVLQRLFMHILVCCNLSIHNLWCSFLFKATASYYSL